VKGTVAGRLMAAGCLFKGVITEDATSHK